MSAQQTYLPTFIWHECGTWHSPVVPQLGYTTNCTDIPLVYEKSWYNKKYFYDMCDNPELSYQYLSYNWAVQAVVQLRIPIVR